MNTEELLDSELEINLVSRLKSNRKKYVKWIAILTAFNTILFGLLIKGPNSMIDNFKTALYTCIIGFTLLGFTFGLIGAAIPYKGLSYKKKYLRTSLLIILAFQVLMALGITLIGLLSIVGWY